MAIFYSSFIFIFDSFKLWFSNIFVTPFSNFEALWILVPIYLGLVITEIFQEKKGTSMGNAISNSIIILWGGVDFLRTTINRITFGPDPRFFGKLAIATMIVLYGLVILVLGIKAKEIIKYIGRVRWACYFIIIFTPLYYTQIPLSLKYIFGAVIFAPLFYLSLYLLDKFTPDPQAFVEDIREA